MENDGQKKSNITPKQELGKIIKKIREKNSLSQTDVAKKFNVEKEFVATIENGEEDASRTNSHNRMWVTRYLKRMNEYNDKNKYVVNAAYPQNIEDEMKIQSKYAKKRRRTTEQKKKRKISLYEPSNEPKKVKLKKLVIFIIVLSLVVYVLLAMFSYSRARLSSSNENPTTLVENTTLNPKDTDSSSTKGAETVVTKGNLSEGVQVYNIEKLPSTSEYNLEIDVQGDAYISIYDLAKTNIFLNDATIYKTGEKINLTISNVDDLIINAGYAANLKIKVNGVSLDTSDFPKDQLFVKITNKAE